MISRTNNNPLPKPGEYATIQRSSNFKIVYTIIACTPLEGWKDRVRLVYTTECEISFKNRDSYGNPIWEAKKCLFYKDTCTSCNVEIDTIKPSTDMEIALVTNALSIRGVIWNSKKLSFDDRPLPDISNGLLLNKDTAYSWHKVLKPYIGKVYFSENEDNLKHPYESSWSKIWHILLKEKFRREDKTHKRSFEMEEHMFEVLRTLYQAPLLKVSYDFEGEKNAHKAFIIAEKDNRYDDERGFVVGEPKLHLVTNMTYLVNAVCRVDLYKRIKNSTHSNLKLYFPK